MEVDTWASLLVISEELYNSFFSAGQARQLVESGIVLRTYTAEEVKPKGSCSVNVCYDWFAYSLPLLVVGGKGPASGIPSTGVLVDNILIAGPSTEEQLDNIEKVLRRRSEASL